VVSYCCEEEEVMNPIPDVSALSKCCCDCTARWRFELSVNSGLA